MITMIMRDVTNRKFRFEIEFKLHGYLKNDASRYRHEIFTITA